MYFTSPYQAIGHTLLIKLKEFSPKKKVKIPTKLDE